jgi:hypothetical protein
LKSDIRADYYKNNENTYDGRKWKNILKLGEKKCPPALKISDNLLSMYLPLQKMYSSSKQCYETEWEKVGNSENVPSSKCLGITRLGRREKTNTTPPPSNKKTPPPSNKKTPPQKVTTKEVKEVKTTRNEKRNIVNKDSVKTSVSIKYVEAPVSRRCINTSQERIEACNKCFLPRGYECNSDGSKVCKISSNGSKYCGDWSDKLHGKKAKLCDEDYVDECVKCSKGPVYTYQGVDYFKKCLNDI